MKDALPFCILLSIFAGFAIHAGDKPETIKYEFKNLWDVYEVGVNKDGFVTVLVLAASNQRVRVAMPVHTKDEKTFVIKSIRLIEYSDNYHDFNVLDLTLLPKKATL